MVESYCFFGGVDALAGGTVWPLPRGLYLNSGSPDGPRSPVVALSGFGFAFGLGLGLGNASRSLERSCSSLITVVAVARHAAFGSFSNSRMSSRDVASSEGVPRTVMVEIPDVGAK